jgi:hypothetical protein
MHESVDGANRYQGVKFNFKALPSSQTIHLPEVWVVLLAVVLELRHLPLGQK